jgi:hypothetical protein
MPSVLKPVSTTGRNVSMVELPPGTQAKGPEAWTRSHKASWVPLLICFFLLLLGSDSREPSSSALSYSSALLFHILLVGELMLVTVGRRDGRLQSALCPLVLADIAKVCNLDIHALFIPATFQEN